MSTLGLEILLMELLRISVETGVCTASCRSLSASLYVIVENIVSGYPPDLHSLETMFGSTHLLTSRFFFILFNLLRSSLLFAFECALIVCSFSDELTLIGCHSSAHTPPRFTSWLIFAWHWQEGDIQS